MMVRFSGYTKVTPASPILRYSILSGVMLPSAYMHWAPGVKPNRKPPKCSSQFSRLYATNSTAGTKFLTSVRIRNTLDIRQTLLGCRCTSIVAADSLVLVRSAIHDFLTAERITPS